MRAHRRRRSRARTNGCVARARNKASSPSRRRARRSRVYPWWSNESQRDMHVLIARDADELAEIAADVFRERVRARPDLVMAVPAGRTPRRMYARMAQLQARAPIMAAGEVVVLVSGEAKRAPLARMLDGSVTPEVPASLLRTRPRCLVITDRAARP